MTELSFQVLLRLTVAVICGAVMGLHIGLLGKPGGLRTHILTTVGAALFCVTSQRLAGDSAEVLRAVQGIASGVGFIGAAAVLRRDGSVRGIATGASLWIAAAVGCSAGFGDSLLALVVSMFVAVVNVATLYVDRKWIDKAPLAAHIRHLDREAAERHELKR
jgi:putative Mg2+ transporter-C (MgtC) family protein